MCHSGDQSGLEPRAMLSCMWTKLFLIENILFAEFLKGIFSPELFITKCLVQAKLIFAFKNGRVNMHFLITLSKRDTYPLLKRSIEHPNVLKTLATESAKS